MGAGIILLRILPVLSTTSTLTFTFCEYLFLVPYTNYPNRLHGTVNEALPPYVSRWFPPAFRYILVMYTFTWGVAVANLAVQMDGLSISGPSSGTNAAAWSLYLVGLVFSIGHMAWGPKAKGLMDAIGKEEQNKESISIMKKWLRLNTVRGFLADVPAWACFLAGFLVSVRNSVS